ncbi:quinone oxidoreductase family protein [Pollutimonas subterranea]|nr:quinone oxidoreductase [Pollutimonas subterranea]
MFLEDLQVQQPGPGEVWLEHAAIGVNPQDINHRSGATPISFPSGLGLEGAGYVVALGEGVKGLKVGDPVGYATGPIGAYASARVYPAERLVKLPDSLKIEEAAALLFKGITAQYLLKTTYKVGPGTQTVIYGAAGALGQLMCSWAKHLGATVIGVVSKNASVDRAKAAGCDAVFVFDPQTLPGQIKDATGGFGAHVVYDPVGRTTLEASMDSLRTRGLLVSFGVISGVPDPIDVRKLNAKGSLYVTRPSLAAHTATAAEYQERVRDVLSAVQDGFIKPCIWREYALADVATAHADIEAGRTRGAIVLRP